MVKSLARPGLEEDDAFATIGRETGKIAMGNTHEAGSEPLSPTARGPADPGVRG